MDSISIESSLRDRVYLDSIRQIYGQGLGNVAAILVGALIIAMILLDAAVAVKELITWFSIISIFCVVVLLVERAFARIDLTLINAGKWKLLRTVPGACIGVMYGAVPFLFGDNLLIHHEMGLVIIYSAMVSVASSGFVLMPPYYFTLNAVTMLPLTAYFLFSATLTHTILAIAVLVWQVVVLSKSWEFSKAAIREIYLNESLRDEIEQHKQATEQLQYLATHDGLTGLPNRQLLIERLDFLIKRAIRYEKTIVVMFLDLDGFKELNDIYGHESGDIALKEISGLLLSTTRETDIVARYGGDEFVLVYSDIEGGIPEAEVLARRVMKLLQSPVSTGHDEPASHQVSGSIGIAIFPGTATESKALIKAADQAMYATKAKGKNGFTFARPQAAEHTDS